ncbi:hypothetical protein BGW36DRAFT_382903 [Talaromyces proteolyticus]|uniref:BZIP domain-containing protein n=1 Tax=Talaromyces proteolyticus TaxID=1131652 RepID=A0AAD4KTG5_9EURO|nr:uncharacterized protein BGW36DRAFT_382903 [Talaromyces proteolyticus]KAH8695555.1 hypothetical protein BGW36DRAFT_382903 [Talaromyces proteolyticus]
MEPTPFPPMYEFSSNSSSRGTPINDIFLYTNNALPFNLSPFEIEPLSQHPFPLEGMLKQTSNIEPPTELKGNSQATELVGKFKNRRRAQNRASQRAFRERKEKYIKSLESQLSGLQEEHTKLLDSHQQQTQVLDQMKGRVEELTAEIENLRLSVPIKGSNCFAVFDLVPFVEMYSGEVGRGNDTNRPVSTGAGPG